MSETLAGCEICGKDPEVIVLLPKARGNDKLTSCVPCAIKSGLYCEKHQRPHIGFEDGLSACLLCINEESKRREETGGELLQTLRPLLRRGEREGLDGWLESTMEITGSSEGHCFMRAVVGKALRLNEPIETIQIRIIEERSIRFIF